MNEIEYLDSVGAISVIFGVCVTVWRKLIVPINKLFITNKELVEAVKKIQSEVTTNGGKSIKDTVNSLRDICETIHYRQQIIDQRTLASLHYIDAGLFETDTSGKLIWTNEAFYKITGETQSNVEGYDWMSFIDEDDREQTINEFASCIKMARKFYIKTKDIHGKTTIFSGYPYKTGENRHGGYLINVTQP
jgi:PAS domain-containing protein